MEKKPFILVACLFSLVGYLSIILCQPGESVPITATSTSYMSNSTNTTTVFILTFTISSSMISSSTNNSSIDCYLDKPQNVNASNGIYDNKILIEWSYISNATGYTIYRSESESGEYAKIGTSTTTHYEDLSLAAGTTMYYQVGATRSECQSELSTPVQGSTCTLDAPSNPVATLGEYDKIVLTWDSVVDAIEYVIYRSETETGTYTEVGTSTTTQYEDASLSLSTTFYYYVRARKSECWSLPSTSVQGGTCALGTPQNILATNGSFLNEIEIRWDRIIGSDGYTIYRSDSETGSYVEIGTSPTTSFSDSSLPSATVYFYKVSAYNDVCGSFQSIAAQGNTWNSPFGNVYRDNLSGWDAVPDTGITIQQVYGDDGTYVYKHTMSYTDNGDGTITDNLTHLMWEQAPSTSLYSWDAAKQYCEGFTFATHEDWRVPTLIELQSLVDYSISFPSTNTIFTCQLSYYWSSTHLSSTSSVYMVDFGFGGRSISSDIITPLKDQSGNDYLKEHYVRCVR